MASEADKNKGDIFSSIGALVGMVAGGPVGAAVGGGLGSLLGGGDVQSAKLTLNGIPALYQGFPGSRDCGFQFFFAELFLAGQDKGLYIHGRMLERILLQRLNKVVGKTWAPNQLQPRWIIEGLATYEESKHSSGGRLRHGLFGMILRMGTLAGDERDLDEMSSGPRAWRRLRPGRARWSTARSGSRE